MSSDRELKDLFRSHGTTNGGEERREAIEGRRIVAEADGVVGGEGVGDGGKAMEGRQLVTAVDAVVGGEGVGGAEGVEDGGEAMEGRQLVAAVDTVVGGAVGLGVGSGGEAQEEAYVSRGEGEVEEDQPGRSDGRQHVPPPEAYELKQSIKAKTTSSGKKSMFAKKAKVMKAKANVNISQGSSRRSNTGRAANSREGARRTEEDAIETPRWSARWHVPDPFDDEKYPENRTPEEMSIDEVDEAGQLDHQEDVTMETASSKSGADLNRSFFVQAPEEDEEAGQSDHQNDVSMKTASSESGADLNRSFFVQEAMELDSQDTPSDVHMGSFDSRQSDTMEVDTEVSEESQQAFEPMEVVEEAYSHPVSMRRPLKRQSARDEENTSKRHKSDGEEEEEDDVGASSSGLAPLPVVEEHFEQGVESIDAEQHLNEALESDEGELSEAGEMDAAFLEEAPDVVEEESEEAYNAPNIPQVDYSIDANNEDLSIGGGLLEVIEEDAEEGANDDENQVDHDELMSPARSDQAEVVNQNLHQVVVSDIEMSDVESDEEDDGDVLVVDDTDPVVRHSIDLNQAHFSKHMREDLPTMITVRDINCLKEDANDPKMTSTAIFFALLEEASKSGKTGVLHPSIFIGLQNGEQFTASEINRKLYQKKPDRIIMPLFHQADLDGVRDAPHWSVAAFDVEKSDVVIFDSNIPVKKRKIQRIDFVKEMLASWLGIEQARRIKVRYAYSNRVNREMNQEDDGIHVVYHARRWLSGDLDVRNKPTKMVNLADEKKRLLGVLASVLDDLESIIVVQLPQTRPQFPHPPPPLNARSRRDHRETMERIRRCLREFKRRC